MRRWVRFVRTTPCLALLLVQLGGVVLTIVALRATPFLTWVSGLVFVFSSAMVGTRLVSLRADRTLA